MDNLNKKSRYLRRLLGFILGVLLVAFIYFRKNRNHKPPVEREVVHHAESHSSDFNKDKISKDSEMYLREMAINDSLRNNISTDKIDRLIQNLNISNISFNVPKELYVNEEHPIILLASSGLPKIELQKALDSIIVGKHEDKIESHTIKTSILLEAQLTGEHFSVTSGNPIRQPLSGSNITKWEWIVEPKVKGEKVLTLTLNAIFNSNGREIRYTIKSFNKKINVKTKNRILYWIKTNETLIVGASTLLATFLAVYYAFYLNKKSSKSKKKKKKKKK